MDIGHFFWQSLSAALIGTLWFALPGFYVLRLLGWMTLRRLSAALLVAPAFGVCTYGPFSLGCAALLGYSPVTLLSSWLLFQVVFAVWLWVRSRRESTPATDFVSIPSGYVWPLLVVSAALAALFAQNIFPTIYEGGLFVNEQIYDHTKIAIVDAIAREGLLPVNPFYAPEGEAILLAYYYTWHFLVSQLVVLVGVTGWQAEVAFTWFTGLAVLSFLCALTIRLTRQPTAGFLLLLFASLGRPGELFPFLFGPHWREWVAYPNVHSLELLGMQVAWVPQHVFSALAVVVIILIGSRLLGCGSPPIPSGVIIGLTAAAGFGASTWVGGVGLACVLPILAGIALWLRLPRNLYRQAFKAAATALVFFGVFSIPLFVSIASGPSLVDSELPIGFKLYPATTLFDGVHDLDVVADLTFFWILFLPVNLGIALMVGLPAMAFRVSHHGEDRVFRALSLGATFGYLFVAQFLESTFWNNTLGWRAVLVPVMLLNVWGAVALTEFAFPAGRERSRSSYPKGLIQRRSLVVIMITVGLTIGLLASVRYWHLPNPKHRPQPPAATILTQHRGFLRQEKAWERVRQYCGPRERVQANPDGYPRVTRWPIALPSTLFANRSTAFSSPVTANVFAYRYDRKERQRQYEIIRNVFSDTPQAENIRYLRDTLKIKVLLVDRLDDVWRSRAIERSGFYDLVHSEQFFRIYVAKDNR